MDWFEDDGFWRDFYGYMFSAERFAAARDEIDRILALTGCSSGRVLDLACGPGRHSVEFARRGFQVTGVDRSAFLLDRARQYANESGVAVEWLSDDMRRFTRPDGFDLACSMFTSFGYFRDEEDNRQVLRNIHASLRSGGVLVMEMVGKERLARNWLNSICSDQPDGALLVQRPHLLDDWCRIRSEWTLIKDGEARSFSFEHSIYSGRELKDMLLSSGFRDVNLYGDLVGAPYGLDALRLVAVARK